MTSKISTAVDGYARRVQQVAQEAYDFQEPADRPVIEVQTLRKYYRLVMAYDGGRGQRSVHSFVDKQTGAVYKPASWNAPTKDPRYNVVTDAGHLHRVVDYAGGYLYKHYTPPAALAPRFQPEQSPKVM